MKVIIAKDIKLAISPREQVQFKKGAEYEVSGQVEERLRHYGCIGSEVVKEPEKKPSEDKPKKGKKRKAESEENKRLNKEDENK